MENENTKIEKKSKGPDAFQQKAIDSIKNTVVSAGAGSGKTSTLSARFLNLIQKRKFNVEEILTLTFTKKATVEMSSRIFEVLQKNAPAQAADFYKSSIMTLDSYCEKIAKRGSQFYGLSPDFSVDNGIVTQEAQNLAVPFALKHRDSPVIKMNVSSEHFRENALSLFVNPILKFSTVSKPIDVDESLSLQRKIITEKWKKFSEKACEIYEKIKGYYNGFDGNRNTAFFTNWSSIMNQVPDLDAVFLSDDNFRTLNFQEAEEFFKKLEIISDLKSPANSNFEDKDVYKEACKALKEVSATISELFDYLENLPLLLEYLKLFEEFQTEFNNMKRRMKILTFSDVSQMALDTLISHPEIRLLEKQKYKAIMIDEFQDNNQMQRDMLFLLAEKIERNDKSVPTKEELCPDKLFFVGDEKQSIYRFRGADVEVFRKLSEDFREGNLEMSINYRSHQALIAAFNTVFGGKLYPPSEYFEFPDDELKNENSRPTVFTSIEQKEGGTQVPSYDAIYHKVTLPEETAKETEKLFDEGKKEELAKTYAPRIHVAYYDRDKYSPEETQGCLIEEEAEAEWVARKIIELTTPDKSGNAKYKASDIAILMRTASTIQPLYERTFLKHGIPYNTEAVSGLFSDGPVNDMILFLNLIVNPTDEDSYRKVLHSPFVNLSYKSISAIQSMKGIAFSEEAKELLSGDELFRYEKAISLYDEAVLYSKKYPLTKLISYLWYESGYCYETKWNHKVERYNHLYDYLFELARKADDNFLSLNAFIDDVNQYQDEKLDDMEIPIEKTPGVSIMTIHKSKGLEFDVVFVVASHKGPKANAEPNAFCSANYGISIKVPGSKNHFFEMTKSDDESKEKAELKRVTYVALTRAKKELFITCGKYPIRRSAEKTIFGLLKPVLTLYKPVEEENEEKEKLPAPFDFQEIEPVSISEISSSTRGNTLEEKISLINKIEGEKILEKAEITEPSLPLAKYIFPSKFYEDEENEEQEENEGPAKGVLYPEVDEIVNSTRPKGLDKNGKRFPPKFSHANFGTISHAYNEALINGKAPEISNKEFQGLGNNISHVEKIKEICSEISADFKESEIGKEAMSSKWHQAEYSFRCRISGKIVKGTIDLVYKNQDGTFTIVDYKTNRRAKPEIYFYQLSCYRKAISEMFQIEKPETIKCVLYYLRLKKAVDISSDVDKINIEDAVKEIEAEELNLSAD